MPIVLCGRSALEYHRTPPPLREVEVPFEQAVAPLSSGGAGMDAELLRIRSNARGSERVAMSRLLTDLKGLSLPIHVMVDDSMRRAPSSRVIMHRLPSQVIGQVQAIGGGLSVLSPVAALADLSFGSGFIPLAKLAFEMAGTYSLLRDTALTRWVMRELVSSGILSKPAPGGRADCLREYYGADGRKAPMFGRDGCRYPWELVFKRNGMHSDMWRRPPLVSSEECALFAEEYRRGRGVQRFKSVARVVHEGAASPLETSWLLLLCLDYRRGGEGWPWPWMNRRVDFGELQRTVSSQGYAICDALWEDRSAVLEVLGEEYHADSLGFKYQTGRSTALEHLGYTVREVTYDQLHHADKLEVVLQTLSRAFGMPLHERTRSFLARRERLCRELGDHTAEF